MAFVIEFSPVARSHLKVLHKRDQQTTVDAVSSQLTHQPDQPTRHRKLLSDNPLAPWELRVGDIRIFYDVDRTEMKVIIVAVGRKTHNRLRIGDEEFEL